MTFPIQRTLLACVTRKRALMFPCVPNTFGTFRYSIMLISMNVKIQYIFRNKSIIQRDGDRLGSYFLAHSLNKAVSPFDLPHAQENEPLSGNTSHL